MIPKFRAWDENGKRYEGSEVCLIGELVIKSGYSATRWEEEARLFNLCQHTGLEDKNGVEIYEHDILKNGNGKIGEVIYLQQEAGYVVSLKRSDYRLGHRNTGEGYKIANNHTVIGNIYENPWLLEVTK